ncbi:MAG: YdcF family protein [Flavobacteriales bacterium]|jgi:SanA protein|nr:YdcF family protein [Flavobacteriales bacterium]MBK7942159.1 YdcF family protein [Flavobacteriales bacterium]MBK8949637.1 YdcF family protein [Flavobacteriales bacterium]MBK9700700.1 YdcF family protein [Flavobacteriales bacterium]
MRTRVWIAAAVGLAATAVLLVQWCDKRVRTASAPHLYDHAADVPLNRVAVLLGTSARARGGGPNLYFTHRIAATVELLRTGRVQHVLISGDNRHASYNEPWDMRRALMAAGVDSTRITLDYAGFRTLDSMVRARDVFGQPGFVVVSQRFHTERAVFLARRLGIAAVGYDAPDVPAGYGRLTMLREKLARVKLHLDLWLGVGPHFPGPPEPIRFPGA